MAKRKKTGVAGSLKNHGKLTERRKRFIREYIVDMNATKAAERAGFKQKTAYSQGQRLLKVVEIQRLISEQLDKRSARVEVRADRVLTELALIAFADIGEAIEVSDQGGVTIRNLNTLKPESRRAIGEITQTSTESSVDGARVVEKVRIGIKHHSKVVALRMLMDHLGMDAPKQVKIDAATTDAIRQSLDKLSKLMSPAAFAELLSGLSKVGQGV